MVPSSVSGRALASWPLPSRSAHCCHRCCRHHRHHREVLMQECSLPRLPSPRRRRRRWTAAPAGPGAWSAGPLVAKGSGGHFRLWSVSWNLVLVYRRWKPFLVMVSSEWNFTRTESPAEYTSSGGCRTEGDTAGWVGSRGSLSLLTASPAQACLGLNDMGTGRGGSLSPVHGRLPLHTGHCHVGWLNCVVCLPSLHCKREQKLAALQAYRGSGQTREGCLPAGEANSGCK